MKFYRYIPIFLIFLWLIGCSGDKSTKPQENQGPDAPTNPSPADGATIQELEVTLSWQCTDPDNDPLTYYLEVDTNSEFSWPIYKTSNLTSSECEYPHQLNYATTYYWQVSARDDNSHVTHGPVWSFSTYDTQNSFSLLGQYQVSNGTWSVEVSGNYAFLGVSQNNDNQVLEVADIANPESIDSISALNLQNMDWGYTSTIHNDYLYLRSYSNYSVWLKIIDIGNPHFSSNLIEA